ncbi:MAG: IPT/TIG domain-containing protein [Candidatus Sericytochromatia bacterium]
MSRHQRALLGLSLCLVTACQTASPIVSSDHPPVPAATVPQLPAPARVSYQPKPVPFGRVETLPNQQIRVHFTYPSLQKGFTTQAFGCDEVAFASISVTGPGMDAPLYADGSDLSTRLFAANSCEVTGLISNVPYGERIVTIRLYDAEQHLLAGSELVGGLLLSGVNQSLELSYRQTNVGELLQRLQSGSVDDQFLAGQLDLSALQQFFDLVTGSGGSYPNYTFTHAPSLINLNQVISDLRSANGNIDSLNPLAPGYVYAPGSARFILDGVLLNQDVTASVDDALSADATVSSNGEVVINQLPPGTWTLRLSGPGYASQRVSLQVNTDGSLTEMGTLTMLSPEATLTGISPSSGVNGQSVTLSGEDFNLTPANNTVRFGETPVTVTSATATALELLVPDGLELGIQPVSVRIGAGAVSTGVNFTVVRPEIDSISPAQGSIGSQVTLTGTFFNPNDASNTVRFGNVDADVVSAESDELVVTVPPGISGTVPVTVSNLQSPFSDGVDFAVQPTLTSLSASTGSTGDTLTLTGTGFSSTEDDNTVSFGGTEASVTAATATSLTVTVPEAPAGSANVTVTVGTQTSAPATFSLEPSLATLSTAAGEQDDQAILLRGQTLTITGTNFDPTPGNNSVSFSHPSITTATVTASTATATQLTVVIPDGVNVPGDVMVAVTTHGQASANTLLGSVPGINVNINNGGFR